MADVITFLVVLAVTITISALIGLAWLLYLGWCVAKGKDKP